MDRDGWIVKLQGLSTEEKWWTDGLHKTQEAEKLRITQKGMIDHLKEIGRMGDVRLILEAERTLIENEVAFHGNSKAMFGSLETAKQELKAANATIEKLAEPERYRREVDEAHSLPKNRIGGVPRDEARQFFKSHLGRLLNQDKSRLSGAEEAPVPHHRSRH